MDPAPDPEPTEEKDSHLTVTKTTTSEKPADGYALGDKITYEIVVKNDGNMTIKDITVTDTVEGYEAEDITANLDKTELAPGEEAKATFEHVVTEQDILAGSVKNEATATGSDPEDEEPEDEPGTTEDPTEDLDTTLTVNKKITNQPEDGVAYKLGETIKYEITVTNEGNVPYNNVVIEDELTGATKTVATLAVGASDKLETEYVVTEADILAGSVKNTATAKGDPIDDPHDPENPKTPEGEDTTETGDEDDPDGPNPPLKTEYKLTIHYTAEGEEAFPDFVKSDYKYGDTYTVTSPTLTGFTASETVVTGTITEDTEKWVTYTRNIYTLTINYRYVGGGMAAQTYTATLPFEAAYDVASPTRAGYRVSIARVTGNMPAGDVVVTVYYIPIPTPATPVNDLIVIDNYGTALGLGNFSLSAGDCIE